MENAMSDAPEGAREAAEPRLITLNHVMTATQTCEAQICKKFLWLDYTTNVFLRQISF